MADGRGWPWRAWIVAALVGLLPTLATAAPSLPDMGSPELTRVWFYTDYPVVAGKAQRTFYYGPDRLLACREQYVEADGGARPVIYLDKARLEETSPGSVTAGLLAKELISGQVQMGDASFAPASPSTTPVAGDAVDSDAPVYASFARVASLDPSANRAPRRTGQTITETLDKAGRVGADPSLARYGAALADYRDELGHNIPAVFVDFFNQRGTVAGIAPDGVSVDYWEDALIDWQTVMGLPLSEAYWARVPVGGATKWVLIQPYERRVVTYTPDNPPAFRVEMGNIGLHYKVWRHPGGSCA